MTVHKPHQALSDLTLQSEYQIVVDVCLIFFNVISYIYILAGTHVFNTYRR